MPDMTEQQLDALEALLDNARTETWSNHDASLLGEDDYCIAEFESNDGQANDEARCACTAALHNAGKALIAMARWAIAYDKYGGHLWHKPPCPRIEDDRGEIAEDAACTCGLDIALKGGDDAGQA